MINLLIRSGVLDLDSDVSPELDNTSMSEWVDGRMQEIGMIMQHPAAPGHAEASAEPELCNQV